MTEQLFVRLYLDEDVSVVLAAVLQARGYSALTTRDAGRLHHSDADQLDFAASHGLAIVTHNRSHFEALAAEYLAAGRSHPGIIIAVRRPASELARRLLRILETVTADELRDVVRYV